MTASIGNTKDLIGRRAVYTLKIHSCMLENTLVAQFFVPVTADQHGICGVRIKSQHLLSSVQSRSSWECVMIQFGARLTTAALGMQPIAECRFRRGFMHC